MLDTQLELGQVVLATAGRDKGKAFIVINSIDVDFVLIANGVNRTIDKPKKKKIKHLDPRPDMHTEIKEKLETGQKVFDTEIRKALTMMGYEV